MGTLPFSWDSLELNDQFFHTLCNHDRWGDFRRSFGLGQRNSSVKKNMCFDDFTKKNQKTKKIILRLKLYIKDSKI